MIFGQQQPRWQLAQQRKNGLIISGTPVTSLLIAYYNEFVLHVPKVPKHKSIKKSAASASEG